MKKTKSKKNSEKFIIDGNDIVFNSNKRISIKCLGIWTYVIKAICIVTIVLCLRGSLIANHFMASITSLMLFAIFLIAIKYGQIARSAEEIRISSLDNSEENNK